MRQQVSKQDRQLKRVRVMAAIPVPPGLHDMLQGFVVCVLRNQPSDLLEFAAQYFADLLNTRHLDRFIMGAETMTAAAQRNTAASTNNNSMDHSGLTDDDCMDEDMQTEMRARNLKHGRRKSICAEVCDPLDGEAEEEARKIVPKTDQQRKRLETVIHKMLMFKSLDLEQIQQILDAMFERLVEPGEHVIDEGDDGDNFYIIERGHYDIFITEPGTDQQRHKGTYNDTGAFGELALMYNCPRLATIIATTPGALWAMDRATFKRIIVRNQFKKRRQFENFLESVPLLSTLTKEERMKVADAMVSRGYEDGDTIIRQGEAADYFYMLVKGSVVVKRKGDDPNNPESEVALTTYSPGNYFGELALIQNQPRAASAYALGPVKCAVLDVQAFERLLGPCKELLMRNIPLYEQQLSEIYKDFNLQD